jgi:hypothetical protein
MFWQKHILPAGPEALSFPNFHLLVLPTKRGDGARSAGPKMLGGGGHGRSRAEADISSDYVERGTCGGRRLASLFLLPYVLVPHVVDVDTLPCGLFSLYFVH